MTPNLLCIDCFFKEKERKEKNIEILDCAWCKSKGKISITTNKLFFIECSNGLSCPVVAKSRRFLSKEKSIKSWNQRS